MTGEEARLRQGIDGTMGDAQDVAHYYVRSANGKWCIVCGMDTAYKKHINVENLLSCGLCYRERGEEVHPHPECRMN